MYARDTILTLKNPRDPDPETGEEFAFNRVKVVGESPINHAHAGSGFTGAQGAGVIITPLTNFGQTLDEPLGKLQQLYDVEFIPPPVKVTQTQVRVIDGTSAQAGPTPEEVFADEAPGVPPEPGQKRGRTTHSPLGDERPADEGGPLGTVEVEDPDVPVTPKPSPLDGAAPVPANLAADAPVKSPLDEE